MLPQRCERMRPAGLFVFLTLLTRIAIAGETAAATQTRAALTGAPEIGAPGAVELNVGMAALGGGQWDAPLLVKVALNPQFEIGVASTFQASGDGRGAGEWWAVLQWMPLEPRDTGLRAAVITSVKPPAPASDEGRGSGSWDGAAAVAVGYAWPAWRCDANVSLTSANGEDETGTPFVGAFSVLVTRPIGERWALFADAAISRTTGGRAIPDDRQALAGVAFAVAPNVVFDVAVQTSIGVVPRETAIHVGFSTARMMR